MTSNSQRPVETSDQPPPSSTLRVNGGEGSGAAPGYELTPEAFERKMRAMYSRKDCVVCGAASVHLSADGGWHCERHALGT